MAARRIALSVALGAGLALVAALARAVEDDRPLDARTYFQGVDAVRQGKRDEAARLLRKVFGDFPDSPYAPQAMLRVAEMIYPVASWDQIGSAAPAAIKEAGDLLAALAQKYRSSREAAKALVRLGYLSLEPANPKADLEEACGRFATAAQLYPDSEAADDAYLGSGRCEALRARPARAADYFSRLLDESPASPLAAEALYRLGVAQSRLDDPAEAMLTLQEVRTRYPDSRYAARALERISLLHRLRLAPVLPAAVPAAAKTPAGGPELYRADDAFVAPAAGSADESQAIRGASDIAIDAQGLVVLASPRTPGVFRLDAKGKIQDRIAHPSPDYVAAGDGLAVYISGRNQIAVNARNWSGPDLQGPGGRAPREFGPLAVDPAGRVYLLDPKDNVLLIFDRNRRPVGSLRPQGPEGRFVDVAMDDEGGVYVLDGRLKTVVELRQGKESRRINVTTLGLQEPVALAVDALGDLYLLDGKVGWVTVADPTGRRITVVRPSKQVQDRLGDPSSLAVDSIGRLYLAGRKTGRVVRFR